MRLSPHTALLVISFCFSVKFDSSQTDLSPALLSRSHECEDDLDNWMKNCYIPSPKWIDALVANASAMDGCRDSCVVREVTDRLVDRTFTKDLMMLACVVKCPCLSLSFCTSANFLATPCPSEMQMNGKILLRCPSMDQALQFASETTNIFRPSSTGLGTMKDANEITTAFGSEGSSLGTTSVDTHGSSMTIGTASVSSSSSITKANEIAEPTTLSDVTKQSTTRALQTTEVKEHSEHVAYSTTTLFTPTKPTSSTELSSGTELHVSASSSYLEESTEPIPTRVSHSNVASTEFRRSTAATPLPSSFDSHTTDVEAFTRSTSLPISTAAKEQSTKSQPTSVVDLSSKATDAYLQKTSTTVHQDAFTSPSTVATTGEVFTTERVNDFLSSSRRTTTISEPSAAASHLSEAGTERNTGSFTDRTRLTTLATISSNVHLSKPSIKQPATSTSPAYDNNEELKTESQSRAAPFLEKSTTLSSQSATSMTTAHITSDQLKTEAKSAATMSSKESTHLHLQSTYSSPSGTRDELKTESQTRDVPILTEFTTLPSQTISNAVQDAEGEGTTITPLFDELHRESTEITTPSSEDEAKTVRHLQTTSLLATPNAGGDKLNSASVTSRNDELTSFLYHELQTTISSRSSSHVRSTVTAKRGWSSTRGSTSSARLSTASSICSMPCPPDYEEGPTYCYRFTPKSVLTYRMAVRFCSLASNSDLADEIDLRNQDVLELLRNMSDARSPSVDLMFVNEKTSKLIKETRTVRIASLQMSSLVLLKVNRTVGIDEHVANATGVCKMPKSCGELSCNLGDFTYYQLGDYIVLPQPRLLAVGEKIEVECAGSKTGAKINVTCGKRGYLNPHPTALPVVCQEKDQDFGERETLWNRRVRRSCAECSKIGTERCEAVDGGFVCHCKEHWTKFTCWKAPQQCDILKLDCHHGVCQSQIDRAVCKCDPGFGGEQCTVNKTALKWYSTTENSVLSAPTFNAAALVCTRVILILAFVLKARNTEGEHLTDPQLHLQVMRAFILALAGLFVIGFRHPAILGITMTECRLWFIVINTMYSTAIALYFLEALNASETASLDHHNTWIGDFYGNTEHRRSLGFRVLSVVLLMLSGSVFVFGTMYNQVASTWTCLGVFSEETVNLWMPLVLFNTIAAMAATAYSYDALFVLRHFPQFRSVQEKHFKTAPRTEKNNVEKCQRDPVFTLIAPWLLLGSWLSVQVSGDWAVDPTVNFLTTTSGLLYSAFDLLHHAITTPSLYSKMMWIAMRRLPSSWAPLEDPVSMWTRDEVLSRFQWRAKRSGTRRARRPHYLHPASEGYMPLKVRKENEKRWSESYTKLREAYPKKTKATIIHLIHRQDVVRLLTKEPSEAKRITIRRVYMRWSSRTYRDDPMPDATLSMETERERMQREWDELRDMLFEFDEDGNVRLREPGELDRVPKKVEEKPKPLKSITMSYVVTIDAYGYTEVHEVFRTPLTHIKAEDLPSTSSARSDVNRIEFGEYKPGSGPINGYVIDKETLAWLEEQSETAFTMAEQNWDYLERCLSLRQWP